VSREAFWPNCNCSTSRRIVVHAHVGHVFETVLLSIVFSMLWAQLVEREVITRAVGV